VTKRYHKELANLEQAYAAARVMDPTALAAALETAAIRPAVMIGSGGSFSVASFAAYLHQLHTGRLANALTPLEYLDLPLSDTAVMCFTASGRNKDIAAAFVEAANREVRPLIGLVMRDHSPLHVLGEKYGYSRLVSASSSTFGDGFLAVASLVGAGTLLLRAYRKLLGILDTLPATLAELVTSTTGFAPDEIIRASALALRAPSTSVLYTAALKPAAADIESRFVEAALGNVHATDFRNFGHGRHHWFAKRAKETGIIALVGDGQRKLADRTLALLPKSVPQTRFDFEGDRDVQALVGLVTSLHIAEAAGEKRGIDPGKPGVPEFGRRLYHLGPSNRKASSRTDTVEIAAWRKQKAAPGDSDRALGDWLKVCERGIQNLEAAKIGALVFDYDGTLCETHRRYEPLPSDVSQALTRLLHEGAIIGIATGRGGSAGERIREAIPRECWGHILMGYYNGAVIAPLNETLESEALPPPAAALSQLESLLRATPHFSNGSFRINASQLSFSFPALIEPLAAVRTVSNGVEKLGLRATISCSSHSVDVTLGDVSKARVVDAIRAQTGVADDAIVVRVGDRGRWPGNDADLLDDPYGLSVDEVSPSTEGCWGLSPRGVLGLQATLYYLDRLHWRSGVGVLELN
jgi:fructoselysine-6-P-deglycase FrlB-like protein